MALNSHCASCGTSMGPEDNDGAITQPEKCARCRQPAEESENPFALKNRRIKALDMASVIDRNALAQQPPIDPYDQAGRIWLASTGWSDEVWLGIAKRAGYKSDKTPGASTRKLVREIYEGRAKAPVSNQVAS
jgi:hypothetical protein